MADFKLSPIGAQTYSLDDKNRVRMPAELFAELGDGDIVITPGVQGNLSIMPLEVFHEINRVLEQADYYDFELQSQYTLVNSMTKKVERDSQNRIIIPQDIKEEFGVNKEVVFIAKRNFVEVWPAETFASRPKPIGSASISKAMQNLGAILKSRE